MMEKIQKGVLSCLKLNLLVNNNFLTLIQKITQFQLDHDLAGDGMCGPLTHRRAIAHLGIDKDDEDEQENSILDKSGATQKK